MTAPRRLLLAITVALLIGQLLGARTHAQWTAAGLACAAAMLMTLARQHAWAAACLCATAIGSLQIAARLTPTFPRDHIVHAAGTTRGMIAAVRETEQDAAGRTRMTLELAALEIDGGWRPAHGLVLVTVGRAALPWMRGDRAQVRLRLRRPRNFGNPGEFDYEAFLARRQIFVTAFAMNDDGWQRGPRADADRALADRWRSAIRHTLARTLDGVAKDITAALIIGETAPLPASLWERYARTGVAHVLSISGLHIALVASAGYGLARWMLSRSTWLLLCTSVPKLSVTAATIPVLLYGVLARGSAPTLRSLTVVVVFGAGMLLDRRHDWLTSLAAAAAVIAVAWPGAVFEISFQLSFASVLSIMIGMPPIVARLRAWENAQLVHLRGQSWRWRAQRALILTLGTTVCASVGTAPLTAYHFNQISLITLIANLLVIPLLGMVPIGAGLLAALCVPIVPDLAALLFRFGGVFIVCADWIVSLLARVPSAAVYVVTPTLPELGMIYGTLGCALLLAGRRRIVALLACGCLLSVDIGYWYWERFHSRQLRVTFLSVGQGDCAIVEFPGSAVMVIDGGGLGGTFDVGQRVLAPFLWRRKIARVDTLVLSHAQYDHYGGLAFLAQAFNPRALWWNGGAGTGPAVAEFWSTLAQHRVPIDIVARGVATRIDGVEVDVLAPAAADGGSLNDRSLVLRLRYRGHTLLFTGDIEADGERRLIERSTDIGSVTILKAPHHGSRTSSSAALLDALRPQAVVISAGYANRFRMPHGEVLARYAAHRTSVWRTDVDGAVTVVIAADGAMQISATRTVNVPDARRIAPRLHRFTHSAALDSVASASLITGHRLHR